MQGGLQIGLTKGQGVSSVQSTVVEWSLARSLDKELVERDLDRTLSTIPSTRRIRTARSAVQAKLSEAVSTQI